MKKEQLFYIISILLFIVFLIELGFDYINYSPFNSAPFYVNIIIRGLEFVVPSIICLVIGVVIKKKNKNN